MTYQAPASACPQVATTNDIAHIYTAPGVYHISLAQSPDLSHISTATVTVVATSSDLPSTLNTIAVQLDNASTSLSDAQKGNPSALSQAFQFIADALSTIGHFLLGIFGLSSNSSLVITSITPVSGPYGTVITIQGQGLTAQNTILLDGTDGLVGITPLAAQNNTITFALPAYAYDTAACTDVPAGATCHRAATLITAGTHELAVQNENGTSTPLVFTVTPYQGSAAFDESSLSQSTSSPTISGEANNVSAIGITFLINDIAFTTDPIPAPEGKWSVQLLSAPHQASWGNPPPTSLTAGMYPIEISDPATGLTLATSTLTITQ